MFVIRAILTSPSTSSKKSYLTQGRRQKNFQEGAMEITKPRNNTNKSPSVVAGWMRTGHAPRAHLNGTLHQEPRVKSEDRFWKNIHFLEKCLPFQKSSGHFLAKKLST